MRLCETVRCPWHLRHLELKPQLLYLHLVCCIHAFAGESHLHRVAQPSAAISYFTRPGKIRSGKCLASSLLHFPLGAQTIGTERRLGVSREVLREILHDSMEIEHERYLQWCRTNPQLARRLGYTR